MGCGANNQKVDPDIKQTPETNIQQETTAVEGQGEQNMIQENAQNQMEQQQQVANSNPVDNNQEQVAPLTEITIKDQIYRRAFKDVQLITATNTNQGNYPLALLKLTFDGKSYLANILTFGLEDLKFMFLTSVAKIRQNAVLSCSVIYHENPRVFESDNNILVGHGVSVPMLLHVANIYHFEPNTNRFFISSHDAKDLVYIHSFEEIYANSIQVILSKENDQLKEQVQQFKKNICDEVETGKYTHLLVFGPVWMLDFIASLQQMYPNCRMRGMQMLYGAPEDSRTTRNEWVNLDRSIDFEEFDSIEKAFADRFNQVK